MEAGRRAGTWAARGTLWGPTYWDPGGAAGEVVEGHNGRINGSLGSLGHLSCFR